MALPPGTEKDQEIQRLGTYIESHVQGSGGVTVASDWESYAAAHPRLSTGNAFLAFLLIKIGKANGASLGLISAAAGKAADQIARGTVAGIDKTGKSKIDLALGEIEKLVIGVGKAVASPVTDAAAVGGFLSNLTQRDFWVRVAKVIIGGAMVITGLAQMSGAGKVLSNVKVLPV